MYKELVALYELIIENQSTEMVPWEASYAKRIPKGFMDTLDSIPKPRGVSDAFIQAKADWFKETFKDPVRFPGQKEYIYNDLIKTIEDENHMTRYNGVYRDYTTENYKQLFKKIFNITYEEAKALNDTSMMRGRRWRR